jgi:hypothetical protein
MKRQTDLTEYGFQDINKNHNIKDPKKFTSDSIPNPDYKPFIEPKKHQSRIDEWFTESD